MSRVPHACMHAVGWAWCAWGMSVCLHDAARCADSTCMQRAPALKPMHVHACVLRRAWEAQTRGIALGAHVPRGISAEARRKLFLAVVPLTGTPLEACPLLTPLPRLTVMQPATAGLVHETCCDLLCQGTERLCARAHKVFAVLSRKR